MIKYQKSRFEKKLDRELLAKSSGKVNKALKFLINHKPLEALQQYCNTVSIDRLGMNDHGRVHTKIAALNALKILGLLKQAEVLPNVVTEGSGTQADAQLVVAVAAYLHDLGMSIARQEHEFHSARVGDPFILEVLRHIYDDEGMVFVMRSYILECIMGHMAHLGVSSIESGIILVSDGCDMEHGRARITTLKSEAPERGDIHRHSAISVTDVDIRKGTTKPIEIFVKMKDATGIFQIEEVLLGKVDKSSVKPYIELSVKIANKKKMYYLR